MMFNKVIKFSQDKLAYLYENSLFLQNIDKIILPFILLTLVVSTFMVSDSIGFFGLIVFFLTVVKILTKPARKLSFSRFELWLIAYFMFVVISLFGSTLFELSLKGFLKTFVYIGFYFSVAAHLKDNRKSIVWVLAAIVLCTAGESIVGFLQSFLHLDEISTWQDTSRLNPEDVLSRVYGTLKPLNPNLFGGYLVCGFPAVLGSVFYFFNRKAYKFALAALGLSLLGVYTIFQTGCRGAYLALMLIFACAFLLSAKFFWETYKKIYFSVIGGVVGLFLFSITFVSALRHRFLSIFAMRNDSSNSFRFNVYHSSLEMFKDNWLLGIGVGNKNFREIYGLYMKTGFDALSAYNIYLETAVESGIFALIAFLGCLITMSIDAVKFILHSLDREQVIFVSVSIVAIWAVMFHGLVDTIYFRPQLQFMFWSYAAIISTLVYQKENA
ncbi:MAG: O-antigen ligase family protein [Muribaculaceae bacterium]|nr:O-antigen ligase family protein [Muribaculaceae bacterium]